MSEEERIRRAEQISAMRNNRIPISDINRNNNKKLSSLGKLTFQVLTSILCFCVCYYLTQTQSYAINFIKPVISNDTDFKKLYEDISYTIKNMNFTNEQNNEPGNNQNDIQNNEQESDSDGNNQTQEELIKEEKQDENKNEGENNEQGGTGGGNDNTLVSKEDDDITFIKNTASFIKPLEGEITSPYGTREPTEIVSANHSGIDIGANIGTEIKASMEGNVELASSEGDYGNHLIITNGEIKTLYAHCSKLLVNQGDHITQGQTIATVGTTGRSTGPHLHFEIRRNNVTVDPISVLGGW